MSTSRPTRRALRLAAGTSLLALAAIGASHVIGQATVPPGPNKLQFPADWSKGVMYATVDRPDTKQYREFYTSAEAVKAAREGKPIPNGTIISLAAYAAKVDANGVPLKDANGRFMKDKLLAVNSMQKMAGWGNDIPEAVRNGDWIYQSFSPEGAVNDKANLTSCYQCHLPFMKDDYLTNLAKLQGKFPADTKVMAKAGGSEVGINNFAFGPGTIKVTAGQKVTWVNSDDTPHQISIVGSPQRSELMLRGQSASLQFDAAGNIAYICGLHPTMKGVVEVVGK